MTAASLATRADFRHCSSLKCGSASATTACGHYSMAIDTVPNFYAGLILIACGTGLLKPNISAMVGQLYSQADKRRDAGFSIFYMGINLGAFLSPIVVGFLAQ